MSCFRVTSVFAVLALVLALTPAPAAACSCIATTIVVPPGGSTGVPLNPTFWINFPPHGTPDGVGFITVTLVGPGGSTIDLPLVQGPDRWRTARPDVPLQPRTSYTLRAGGASGPELAVFSTGDEADRTPPAVPRIANHARTTSGLVASSCGAFDSIALDVLDLSDDATPPAELLLSVFTGPWADGIDATTPVQLVSAQRPALSDHMCAHNFPTGLTRDLAVRVRAIDWAGNVSELSAPRQLKSCGCASLDAPLAAAAVLLLARRRRPRVLHRGA